MTARPHHRVTGDPDAPALVFGPSLGTDLRLFDQQVVAFAADFRVVRFDLPGHGGSEAPAGPYTVQDLAEGVLGLLDELSIAEFDYVGISIGGAIGQWLGLTCPDRVRRLVVCATAARFADPESWSLRAHQVRSEGTAFLEPSRYGTWFTTAFPDRDPEAVSMLLGMLRNTAPEGYAGCCEAIGAWDLLDRLADITVPTLVVAGEADPATTVAMCRVIAEGIPGARLEVLPDSAHLPNIEQPEAFNRAVGRHLRE